MLETFSSVLAFDIPVAREGILVGPKVELAGGHLVALWGRGVW